MDGRYADGGTPLELASGRSLHRMPGWQSKKKNALMSSMIPLATSADPDQM